MPTKLNELKLVFLVAPLDDLCDSETPIMSKWQVKEAMHNLLEDYIEKLIDEGEWASVIVAGRNHKVKTSDPDSDS